MSGQKSIPIKIEKIGVVVSDSMEKTRVVRVEQLARHSLFSKRITKRNRFYVHDENNVTRVGDLVKIRQCRPLSKLKRWKIVEIMKRDGNKESGVDNGTVAHSA